MRFELGAECMSLAREGERSRRRRRLRRRATAVVGSHVLLAVGRRPNTDGLGLEQAGIRTDARGYIEVDDQCRTSAEGVWAVGDCNGRGAFTHTSWNDHEIVVAQPVRRRPAPHLRTASPATRSSSTRRSAASA